MISGRHVPPPLACSMLTAVLRPARFPALPPAYLRSAIVSVRQQQPFISESQVFEALEKIHRDKVCTVICTAGTAECTANTSAMPGLAQPLNNTSGSHQAAVCLPCLLALSSVCSWGVAAPQPTMRPTLCPPPCARQSRVSRAALQPARPSLQWRPFASSAGRACLSQSCLPPAALVQSQRR
jgi:hypothetical protein